MPPYINVDDVELMRFIELFRKLRDEQHLNDNEEEEYYTLLIKIVRGF